MLVYPRAALLSKMTPGNLPAGIQSRAAKAERGVRREPRQTGGPLCASVHPLAKGVITLHSGDTSTSH